MTFFPYAGEEVKYYFFLLKPQQEGEKQTQIVNIVFSISLNYLFKICCCNQDIFIMARLLLQSYNGRSNSKGPTMKMFHTQVTYVRKVKHV